MSIDFKLHIRHLVTALLLLPLLCACSSEDDATDATPVIATANDYINLNFVVSTGEENVMRGAPFGGEDGDGREVGSKSENAVEGITLMLYQDDAGINTTNATTTIAYAKYFPVTLSSRNNSVGSSITDPKDEAVYTTGDQSLGDSQLDLTKKYHAIVVANLNLTSLQGKTVQEVRDHLVTSLYEGAKVGNDAWSFVMSLERDVELDFANTTSKVTTTSGKTYYTFDNIYIERLAARVDFWTQDADYNETLKGYEYKVYKDASATEQSKDKFVLTGITPFNLLTSGEYLIKRTDDDSPYLAQETWENYVKDPKWADNPTYAYANPLSGLATKPTLQDVTPYYQSTEMLHGNNAQKASFTGDDGKENFILCYPMENTLKSDFSLYDYATGLAIEGDYYEEGWEVETESPNPKIKHLVYYGYLRHQGENTNTTGSYPIYSKDKLDKNQTGSATTAMNFGVVRNNIYRVSIGTITEKREVQLVIKVKMWDTFIHDVIYM